MQADLAMVAMAGGKRVREKNSSEGATGDTIESSRGGGRGVGGAGGGLVSDCTLCGKALSRSGHLTRHIRNHSGDRPYACTTCGQVLSHSSNRTAHMCAHSGDRPYLCTTCGKASRESGNQTRKNVHAHEHE